ncbi:hypothetical protein FQZ97_880850 [compost metagenome]
MMPLCARVPRLTLPRLAMDSGRLPSGSLSLAVRARVSGTPALVAALSGLASGGWLVGWPGGVPSITTNSLSLPPAADFTVILAGGCSTLAATRRWVVPLTCSRRPTPSATRVGTCSSSLERASTVSVLVAQE